MQDQEEEPDYDYQLKVIAIKKNHLNNMVTIYFVVIGVIMLAFISTHSYFDLYPKPHNHCNCNYSPRLY